MESGAIDLDTMIQLTAAVITIGSAYAAMRSFRTKHIPLALFFLLLALLAGAVAIFFGTFKIRLF